MSSVGCGLEWHPAVFQRARILFFFPRHPVLSGRVSDRTIDEHKNLDKVFHRLQANGILD